jgi:hypothetical protein
MTQEDDWVERMLRADRAIPPEDGGFTDALMARVPIRQAASTRWIVPTSVAAGAILAAAVSLGNGLLPVAKSLVAGQNLGTAGLLPLFLIWAGCAWILSEAK